MDPSQALEIICRHLKAAPIGGLPDPGEEHEIEQACLSLALTIQI